MDFDLSLINFRNYKERSFQITPPTIIIGPNASGKTNILESIFLISTTNSFKKTKVKDFILDNKDFAKITIKEADNQYQLRFLKEPKYKKEAYLDERKVQLSELVGSIPTVIFAPESLHIIKGSPSLRRSFLNITLSQFDRDYLESLLKYNKVKQERNQLLYLISIDRAQEDELGFWSRELVRSGSYLIKKRLEYIKFLNERINKIYNHLSKDKHSLSIDYQTNALDFKNYKLSLNQIKERFSQTVDQSLKTDIKYTTTTKGPHRDDFDLIIDGRPISGIGSQGEIRSLSFAIKLLERDYLKNKINKEPLFLLDDPLSELDDFRAKYLLDKIKNTNSIVTALEEELRGIEKLIEDFQIIKLEE
jgi:DNA replication and repair protein RecF